MKKKVILSVASAIAVLALTPAAGSAATRYPTSVAFAGASCSGGSCTVVGSLSTTRKCQWLRKVRLYKRTSSGLTRLDTVLSSGQGAWAFHYPETSQLRIVVTEAVRFDGDVICQGGTRDDTLEAGGPVGGGSRQANEVASPSRERHNPPARRPSGLSTAAASYPTTLRVGAGVCHSGGGCRIAVTLQSTRKCQWLRLVKVYERTGSGLVRLDTILSSGQGAAGFAYPSSVSLRFVASAAVRSGGDVECESGTLDYRF